MRDQIATENKPEVEAVVGRMPSGHQTNRVRALNAKNQCCTKYGLLSSKADTVGLTRDRCPLPASEITAR